MCSAALVGGALLAAVAVLAVAALAFYMGALRPDNGERKLKKYLKSKRLHNVVDSNNYLITNRNIYNYRRVTFYIPLHFLYYLIIN